MVTKLPRKLICYFDDKKIALFFFCSYALYILLQYPISTNGIPNLAFYILLQPITLVYVWHHKHLLEQFWQEKAFKALAALFCYVCLNSFLLLSGHEMLKAIGDTIFTMIFFIGAVLFFMHANKSFLVKFFYVWEIIAGICAFISIYRYSHLLSDEGFALRLCPIGRTANSILGANNYAIAGIVAWFCYYYTESKYIRSASLASTLVISAMIILTQSRMAISSYFVALLIGAYLYTRRISSIVKIVILIAIVLATFVVLVDFTQSSHFINLIEGLLRKDLYRVIVWKLTIEKILQHPIIGNGMFATVSFAESPADASSKILHSAPHDIYLAILFYYGIPAFMLFVYIIIKSCLWGARLLTSSYKMDILAVSLLFYALCSGLIDQGPLVKGPSPLWLFFWQPLAIIVALMLDRKQRLLSSTTFGAATSDPLHICKE